jgi:hypothetical protein
MKPTDRQKMCSHCDGRVPFEASECPYCGHEFPEESKASSQTPLFKNQSLQESLASLYTPPYNQSKTPLKSPPLQKKPIEMSREPTPIHPLAAGSTTIAATADNESNEVAKKSFWSLFALIVGGNLFILGLLQLFFSEEGVLRLEWDGSFWYLYCLISLPLFYFGYKKAKELN